MTRRSRQIVFFGTDQFSLTILESLVSQGYDISYVVTKPDARKGRGHMTVPPPVKVFATVHEIPVLQPTTLRDDIPELEALVRPLGVLASYGRIIPQRVLNLFSPGIINVHPSLLPKYRGPTPIETAIANGDQETGVSIIKLVQQMDAGPVYAYSPLELTGRETQPELYHKLAEIGALTLSRVLPDILDGTITDPLAQDESLSSYTQLLTKEDAYLHPEILDAAAAERKIRAHLVFPKTKYTILDRSVIITKSHVSESSTSTVPCANNTFLAIDELIAPSGKTMNFEAFCHGYS